MLLLTVAAGGCAVTERRTTPSSQIRQALEATPSQLVSSYDEQANAVRTLSATVKMSPVTGSAYSGVIQQYHDVGGFILAARPAMIRIIGQAPVVATNIFDMVSDGRTFRIFIPSKNKFLVGSNRVERAAKNPIENLRPQHIFEALFWAKLPPDAPVLFEQVDAPLARYYVLTVLRGAAPHFEIARKIWFDRVDLRVSRVQIFGANGKIDSDIVYSDWQMNTEAASSSTPPKPASDTLDILFPREVRITRPQQDYELVVSITKLSLNSDVPADRFDLPQPSGTDLVDVQGDTAEAQP